MTGSARVALPTNDPGRRLSPRLWDSDWLVMRGLSRTISALAARLASPGLNVIDFGCGSQPYRPVFERLGYVYVGADLGDAADIRINDDGLLEAPSQSADLVVSIQVLEHVRDLDLYLGEARRVLRPNGRLLLSTHGTWLYHPHPGDYRRWTRSGLIVDLEQRGFLVEDCIALVGPLAWTTMLRMTGFSWALSRLPALGSPLRALLCTLMNIRCIVEDKITPHSILRDNACVYVTVCRPDPTICKKN
jgi:SAM-dependent methyltransferase